MPEENVKEEMGLLERRKIQPPEVYLMPTSYCPSRCKYCYLNKNKIALREKLDWDKFFRRASDVLLGIDYSEKGAICITGGELFCDDLLVDQDYKDNLKKLFIMVGRLVNDTTYRLAVPVGLENIGELGRDFIKWLKGEVPGCQILCAFTAEKFGDKNKTLVYYDNLEKLKPYITAMMCILIKDDDYHLIPKSGIGNDFAINYDEPIQLNKNLTYSYGDVDWYLKPEEYHFSSPHCTAHRDIIVTTDKLLTCGQVTVKPDWVDDKEWNRFCNDRMYLDEGYQQVLDWYGCNDCEKRFTCPGMCWISYYAQKNIYNNRKCLYK